MIAAVLVFSGCDDDRASSGGNPGTDSNNQDGGGDSSSDEGTGETTGDDGGAGEESPTDDGGAGEEGSTAENPTPGCYATEGVSDVDLGGLELAPFPDGLLPGEPCDTNSDCKYGLCSSDSLITQGAHKICIKKCGGCGDKSPACNWDDDEGAGLQYTCVIAKFNGENQSHCAVRCDEAAECASISPEYSTCNDENAGRKYCGNRD
jgi:hypothetical protein